MRLRARQQIVNPESGERYRVGELLGAGAFGAVYAVSAARRTEQLCLKVTGDQESWHREAYLSQLLAGQRRVLTIHSTFPLIEAGRLEGYALVIERAMGGTVADSIEDGIPWPERRAVAEIKGLLGALARLHAGGAFHRDLTPYNVFVCSAKGFLKMGDFGIATHGPPAGVAADIFHPVFADPDIHSEAKKHWTRGDDLWQLGQLLAVLLTGEAWPITTRDVKDLDCSDSTKTVIRRAIGERHQRFTSASSMATALNGSTRRFGRPKTLDGKNIVFTGPMDQLREVATRRAKRAGADVQPKVTWSTDVIVVGDRSPHFIAGSAGVKLLEADALNERGARITFIRERHFLRLV